METLVIKPFLHGTETVRERASNLMEPLMLDTLKMSDSIVLF